MCLIMSVMIEKKKDRKGSRTSSKKRQAAVTVHKLSRLSKSTSFQKTETNLWAM